MSEKAMQITLTVQLVIPVETWATEYGLAEHDVPEDVSHYFQGQTITIAEWLGHVEEVRVR